ncbi:two-partner secretion domain-containing protein [Luteimonas qiangzhengi]|uniref:two-partner secretion domain-containing protein n=1 Tax=Luteimonas sp. MJ146 TaxID=3129240 RepID=UPI0031B9B4E1
MNRIYSLVFNHALRQVQVVSEHAQRRRGSTSRRAATRGAVPAITGLATALALAAIPLSVSGQTLPGGDVIRGGIDNITTTPAGDTMVIDQGNHLRGLIDWATFDIGEGYTVRFDQLADAVALNVIGDVNPSQIYGNLEATGTVFLINPNGIIFGDTAWVNVGGLIASTLQVDGNVFLDGGDGIAMTSSGIPASITNDGVIVATGAQGVTLLGGHLSNTGIITAETGSINLLGTQTATLSFGAGNRLSIAVDGALTAVHNEPAVVHNNGVLNANGGRVFMHANVASGVLSNAVNHAGIITASGIDAEGNGGVVLSGGGSGVVQSGSITSGADALITAEGAVSLDGDSLDVTGLTVDAGSLDIESGLDLDGNLSITVADGGISQSGAWQVGGTSTLDAGSGQIRLDNAGNDFLGAVNLTGGEVSIQDKNALGLGALDVGSLAVRTQSALGLGSGVIGGNLVAVSNSGGITQSPGGLQVGWTSVLDAGYGGISLGQAGNRFDGAVQLRGNAVTIASDLDLDIGTLDVGSLGASSAGSVTFRGGSVAGNFGVTSGGDISQTGAITVGGVSTLVAQGGSIALAHSGNDFAGTMNLDAEGAAEVGSTGTLILGAVDVGTLDAVSTSIVLGGDIETDGDQRYDGALRLAADVALASGAGDVAFEGSVDGTHALTVEAAAGAATFGGPVGITTALASLTADAGSVSIGNRLVVFGDLALTAATGGIAQGAAWQVGGTGMLDAGTDVITLTQVGNDFVGAVHLAGGDVSIQDVNALTLATLDVGTLDATSVGALNLGSGGIDGNLVAQSNNGAITQSGALDITGTSTLNAGTGSIALADGINRFGGAVTATGNGITLVGQEDLAIAGLTFQPGPGHGIRLEAGGTLTLPGESIDTGPAGLILASNGGELATAATLRGANVSLTGADGIHLGHDVVASTVTLHSGASISQAGGVVQMDSLHVNAGGSVSLDAENQMAELGDVDVGGNFSLRNVPAISQAEETSVSIDGDASFSSGGAITLTNAGNRFGGEVGLSGGAAKISAADALRLGDLAVDSLVAESQGTLNLGRGTVVGDLEATSDGDIGQSGALAVGGTGTIAAGTGAIRLDDAGNDFAGPVSLLGGAAWIRSLGGLQLGDLDVTALSASSGGDLGLGQGEIRGNLQATSAAGDIGQSGALEVDGTSILSAVDGVIALGEDNDFGDTVDLAAGGDVLINARTALTLGTLAVGSLDAASDGELDLGQGHIDGNLVADSNGHAIGQAGALEVGGTSHLDAGSSAITLDQDNRFAGVVDLRGGAVVIRDTGALVLGDIEVSSLVAESGGALNLGSGAITDSLDATSLAGGMTQSGSLLVGGDAALSAGSGDITLDSAGNDFGGTVSLSGGAVSIVDSNTLRLGTVQASSLDATATTIQLGGDIATGGDQTFRGAVALLDDRALESDAGDITFVSTVDGAHALDVAALGAVAFEGDVGAATALSGLDVTADGFAAAGQLNVMGPLRLDIARGGISQAGQWSVTGNVDLEAYDGAIALENPANAFGGTVHLAGGAVAIHGGSLLTLGTVDASSLDATAVAIQLADDINTVDHQAYDGTVRLLDSVALESTDGDVTFGSAVYGAHALDVAAQAGMVTFTGAVGGIDPLTGLTVEAGQFNALSTLDTSGDLSLTVAQDGIDQAGRWDVGGATALDAAGDITLDNADNAFAGTVDLAGDAVAIVNSGALTLGGVDVASLDATSDGDLDLGQGSIGGDLVARSNDGAISQSGALYVGGTGTLDAGGGDIALDEAGNDFVGRVHLTGDATTIVDANALALGDVDVAWLDAASQGDLLLGQGSIAGGLVARSNNGDIDQSGALSVGGTATLDAGDGDITLDAAGNDFAGSVHLTGGGTTIVGTSVLTLASVDVTSLAATAATIRLGDDVSTSGGQAYSGAVELLDDRTLASATGDITFGSTVDGVYALDVAAGAGAVTFNGAVGSTDPLTGLAVDAGRFNALSTLDTSGDLVLTVAEGGVGQGGAWGVGGSSTLDVSEGDITLGDAGNAFAGTVNLAGDEVTIVNSGALTLGGVDVASLDATSVGDLDLGVGRVEGDLAAGSNDGSIGQSGALYVGGTGTLDAGSGDITLDDAGNDFAGRMHLAGGAAVVVDANALALGELDVASLDATSQGDLLLGQGHIAGDLVARSNDGAIGQSGALFVGGTGTLDAGTGDITLDDAGNDFAGTVHLAGGAASIADANALALGAVDVASLEATSHGDLGLGSGNIAGELTARSNGGDIGQSGALAVGGTGTLDAADGAIMLDEAGNDFAGLVHLAGGAVSIVDANALALGDVDVASLAVTSHGDLGLGRGTIAGDLAARSNGGAIGQSGGLRVEGESSLAAGAGAVTLEDEDNTFVGAVDVAGTGIAMTNGTDLLITSLDNRGGAVSLVADGDLTLPTHAIDTGAADLRLAALGGALSAGGALSGGEVSLRGRDGIGIGGGVTALGTLALRSDGAVTRAGGVLTAQVLTGQVAGAAMLGDGNAISELGAFSAGELELGTTGPLAVTGPVDGGNRLALAVGGDLAIQEQVSADMMRLDADGAIGLEGKGRIMAGTLSGSAGGATTLGTRDRFVDNQVAVLGDFTSHAGFSMTNVGTLTLAAVGESEYSIDAGTAVTYLSIVDGDLLQEGTTPIRNGTGFYASTGHIGLLEAPIHVIGVEQQTVEFIGLPPAYFYATRADGTLLPVIGTNAVNVPVSVISSRVQRSSQGELEYVDLGADASGYRAYGIVQPGIRMPDDQRPECDPDFPDPECIDA